MKQRYIIGSVIVLIFGVIAFISLEGSKIEYTNIASAKETGRKVQVKGVWIKEKGADYNSQTNEFTFSMRDEQNNETKVIYQGARPNNFEIAESIVVKGRIENGTLQASDILTKCPSKYEGNAEQLSNSSK
ncbi:MAG TPA: cytochrome c maturation protein CcmE [Candidatus Kapabacteria bacterium]|jgi:cytochrome c-type biogenesis protein CcmE|nr:cytochrome c maturation protein CcmE [Ignavibacteria bacterium]HRE58364.1 cytochrome c maturation protein CcmE [Candidatus Kapabacteria bacterium]HRI31700.1 cytochrome c maturation protein CcmE [Candidatus Kapabacteria bacterium]HRK60255.1 cytochrome c maturation protein CcmE [Candidatus Kapabacteria bacterium]